MEILTEPSDRSAEPRRTLVTPPPRLHEPLVPQQKPKITFLLIADASRARLFRRSDQADELELVEELEHPESRAMNRDLMADKPGRAFTGGGMVPGRSSMEYETDPKDVEAEKFARELGDDLARRCDEHTFDDLVVVAPPKFLGLLRGTLATHGNRVSDRVSTWLDKDYTQLDERTLAERLAA